MTIRLLTLAALGLFATISLFAEPGSASDWTRFRGPNGSGVSPDEATTPTIWGPAKNLKWKTPLPGPGVSSPIVVGDKIFVTCYSGYGVDRRAGDQKDLKRHLVCVDRGTGKVLWEKAVDPYLPEDPFSGMGVPEHGYASHTPVSDGKNVYCFFGKTGAVAFDLEGNQLWKTSVGTKSDQRRWGSASSPILYEDLLIIPATAEAEALVALNTKDGKEVWRQEAGGFANSWSTPVAVKVDDDRTDIVLGVPYEFWGFDPKTGKLRWYCESINTDQMNSSVVVNKDTIIGIDGRSGGSVAVKAGGDGDISKTNVVWTGRHANRFATPIVYEDRVYFISSGVANCIDAKTGEKIYQSRLSGDSSSSAGGGGRGGFGGRGGGSEYSSPVIADGKIYYTKKNGEMFVLKAGKEFEQLAVNRVTEDREEFDGTPAISDGQIFVRSSKHLYCIAEE